MIFVADCMWGTKELTHCFSKITVNVSADSLFLVNFAMTSVSKLHTGRDPALRPHQAGSLNPYFAHADTANVKNIS